MRSFRLPEPVDLVVCEGDALNHVPHRRDLSKVLKAVARALRPGGRFFLDVNNLPGFQRFWKGVVWCETAHVILVMRNGNDRKAGKAWSDIEWFIREGELWRRRSERVEEICWEPGVIPRTLKDVGFDQVRELDATPFFRPVRNANIAEDSLIGPGCRSFYVARKSPI
jgi:SAM-dependent methyltransferase